MIQFEESLEKPELKTININGKSDYVVIVMGTSIQSVDMWLWQTPKFNAV